MALTVEAIQSAENDGALFELLSSELNRHIPKGIHGNWEQYSTRIQELPRGLRAMAGIYFFDFSMALDDLAWHFGNQNDEREIAETLNGLRELEMVEIADYFEKMWNFMKPHMDTLQTGNYGGKKFNVWLVDVGAQEFADPMNKMIWNYCDQQGDLRLLTSWLKYARKHPERCIVAEAQA
jgi:hypothetical protein